MVELSYANFAQMVISAYAGGGQRPWRWLSGFWNILKHYGYHLEHNFGHGEQYL